MTDDGLQPYMHVNIILEPLKIPVPERHPTKWQNLWGKVQETAVFKSSPDYFNEEPSSRTTTTRQSEVLVQEWPFWNVQTVTYGYTLRTLQLWARVTANSTWAIYPFVSFLRKNQLHFTRPRQIVRTIERERKLLNSQRKAEPSTVEEHCTSTSRVAWEQGVPPASSTHTLMFQMIIKYCKEEGRPITAEWLFTFQKCDNNSALE